MAPGGNLRFTVGIACEPRAVAMELFHLRTFVTVAEEGHLTRASERLYTSQPAISAQLKALEEELGVTLFDRTPRGMTLTAAGQRLLADARRTLDAAGDLMQAARGLQNQLIGKVRIGLNTDADFLRLVALQSALRRRHPQLELEFLTGSTSANVPQLRVGKLDASFVSGDPLDPQLALWRLCEEDIAVAVPAHLRAAVGAGEIAVLARQPWVYTTIDCPYYRIMNRLFEAQGCSPARTISVDQEDSVATLVRGGVGLGMLRRERIEALGRDGSMFALPLALPPVPMAFALLERRRSEPVLQAVLEAVAEVWALPAEATGAVAEQAG